MDFGILLSECVHADSVHTACTEVLLQHWKAVCSNVAFVPHRHKEDSKGQTPIVCPALWADPAVCQVLIDAGADIETKDNLGRSPLLDVSALGKLDIVKILIQAGAAVRVTDNEGDTCLILAAYFGHTETVRYLAGLPEVDLNHKGMGNHTALHSATEEGHISVVQVLIDAGAAIETKNKEGNSPLYSACCSGAANPDVLQVLIDAGADIDVKNKFGSSPLHCASEKGELAFVKFLIKSGAGVCLTDDDGDTCLILAAYFGHTETVRYLVGLPEVEVNHKGMDTNTALFSATEEGHISVVQVLIDAGADIEERGYLGRSPLLQASALGKLDIVKMLVKAGAGVRVTDHNRDHRRNTCLCLAASFGHTETCALSCRFAGGGPQSPRKARPHCVVRCIIWNASRCGASAH